MDMFHSHSLQNFRKIFQDCLVKILMGFVTQELSDFPLQRTAVKHSIVTLALTYLFLNKKQIYSTKS